MSLHDQLGKMVGPLPMGAWVALVGGGLAFAYYTRTHSSADPTVAAYDAVSTDPGVGLGGTPSGYSDVTDPGTGTAPASGYTITDNDSWASAAVNALIARGYTPANANSAISKYLAGGTPTLAEWALINIAMSIPGVGAPPSIPTTVTPPAPKPVTTPKPAPKPTPKPPVKKPAPKPTKRKPTKPQAPKAPPKRKTVTYTVKHGDSLSAIAQHYKINWHTLYSANHKKIGNNPNLIHAGLRLTIPHK